MCCSFQKAWVTGMAALMSSKNSLFLGALAADSESCLGLLCWLQIFHTFRHCPAMRMMSGLRGTNVNTESTPNVHRGIRWTFASCAPSSRWAPLEEQPSGPESSEFASESVRRYHDITWSSQECCYHSWLLHFLGLLHSDHLQKAWRWPTTILKGSVEF